MKKERNHVLGEDPCHGKTWVIPCQQFLPLAAGDRLRLGIAEGTGLWHLHTRQYHRESGSS